ncbi:MAG: hypothetical protein AB2A00_42750, partial [Myxococcota bacterium]
ALVVVPAVASFMLAAVLWTTTPAELPFSDRAGLAVTLSQWQVARYVALVVAALLGGVAFAVLLWPREPLTKLMDVAESLRGGEAR